MNAGYDPDLDDILQDEELVHLARLLSSARRAEPPLDEAFRTGLRRQLMQKASGVEERRPSLLGRLFAPPALAWAGATAGVLLIAGVVVFNALQSPGSVGQVVIGSPMDGLNAVKLGQPILVAFNQPMDHASTQAAVQISPATSVSFSWPTSKELAVQPTSGNLAPNTQYKVTIGQSAKTASGAQLLTAPSTITFVTQPPATPPPTPSPKPPPTPGSLLSSEHQVVAISGGGSPLLQWSADSSSVYLVAAGGKLEVVDVKSGAVNVVAADGASSPSMAPGGDRLAYVRGGNIEVVTFATGTTAEVVATPPASVVGWAKDKLVWAASDGFYRRGANGPVQVAPLPAGGPVTSAWIAPDGAHAVFQQDQKLVLLDLATGNSLQLGQAGAQFLGWSPDGAHVLYSSPDGTVVADTKNAVVATLPAGDASWSSQDAILLGSDVELNQMRPDGSARSRLANGTYHAPSWAPNGITFAFFRGGALWTAVAPALPPPPTNLDVASIVVNSFMYARLQNQSNAAMTFLDDSGKQAYATGGLNLIPSGAGDQRFSRFYILTQEVTATTPATARFVVRLVLQQGKLEVSDFEETLTLVRDPATRQFLIDQATVAPNRQLGKGAEVVGVDVTAGTIKLTFDSDLNPATVSGGVLIIDDRGKQLDSTVTYGDRAVTITGLDLKAGRQYRLVVLTTVRDVVGNNTASEYDLNVYGPVDPNRHGDNSQPTASPTPQPSPTPS
jgi:Big-like domain-containing protein